MWSSHSHLERKFCVILFAELTRGALQCKTGLVICVCDWLRDESGLDFCDRSWICNATQDCTDTS